MKSECEKFKMERIRYYQTKVLIDQVDWKTVLCECYDTAWNAGYLAANEGVDYKHHEPCTNDCTLCNVDICTRRRYGEEKIRE